MNSKVRSFTVKRTGISCLALAVAASVDIVSVNAQTAGQAAASTKGKVGIIYFQGAIVGSKDGQKAAAELEAKAAAEEEGAGTKQNEVNALQDQLTKGQNTLSDAAKNELYRNIEAQEEGLTARLRGRQGRNRAGAAEADPANRAKDDGGDRKIRARITATRWWWTSALRKARCSTPQPPWTSPRTLSSFTTKAPRP